MSRTTVNATSPTISTYRVRVPLDWPDEFLLLASPYSSIYRPDVPFWKLAATREPVAWGFSYKGNSLIAAMAEGVMIFTRGQLT